MDRVRLTVAGLPVSSATAKLYSIDALVESSQSGLATSELRFLRDYENV